MKWHSFQVVVLFTTLFRHNKKRPWEALIVLLTIAVAYTGTTSIFILNYSAIDSVDQSGPLYPTWHIVAQIPEKNVSRDDYAALRRLGFRQAIAYSYGEWLLHDEDDDSPTPKNYRVLALDQMSAWQIGAGISPTAAQASTQNGSSSQSVGLILTQSAAQPGTVHLVTPNGHVLPLAVANDTAFSNADILLDVSTYFDSFEPSLTGIYLFGEISAQQRQDIEKWLPAHLQLSPVSIADTPNSLSKSLKINLWAMTVMMIVVCGFVVINAINLSLRARLVTLTTLRQLGVPFFLVRWALMLEYFLLNVAGATIGVPLGLYLTSLLSADIVTMLEQLLAHPLAVDSLSVLNLWFSALCIGTLMMLLIVVLPLSQLKHSLAFSQRHNKANDRLITALLWLSMLAVLILALLPKTLVLGLLLLASVLILGCCVLFLVFPRVLRAINRPFLSSYPIVHWAVANTDALAKRTKLATCAFFIALTTNVGMNLMVDSFRDVTDEWINQRIDAPAYLFFDPQSDVDINPTASMYRRLRDTAFINDKVVSVRGLAPDYDDINHLSFDSAVADVDRSFFRGRGILINQQLSIRQGIGLNQMIEVYIDSKKYEVKVLGVYPDYGNPSSQIMVPNDWIAGSAIADAAYALLDDEAIQYAQRLVALNDDDLRFQTRASLIDYSMDIFDRTFFITDKLNVVTSLVAALSLGLAMLLITFDLKPQLALLKVMGVSIGALRLAILGQYALIGLVSVLMAIPFGFALSYVLVNYINVAAFQWHYPLVFDLGKVIGTLTLSFLIVIALLILPLQRVRFESGNRTQQLW